APDLCALFAGDLLDLIAVDGALEVAAERIDEIAIADAVDCNVHDIGIDAEHRDTALAVLRQHIGLAGKAREWFAITHIDGEIRRFCQTLAHYRRQAGAQRDRIALAVLEALDAKLLLVRRDRRPLDTRNGDE